MDTYTFFTLLKFIYIGQNIRTYGLLLEDCRKKFPTINRLLDLLFELKLIEYSPTKTNAFRNLDLINTTNSGNKLASHLVKSYLDNIEFENLMNNFGEFLLFYICENKLIEIDNTFRYYAGSEIGIYDLFFKGKLYNLSQWSLLFYQKIQELFLLLRDQYNIAVSVNNYAGTDGGQKRQPQLIIPNEFISWLENSIKDFNIQSYGKFLKKIELNAGKGFFLVNFFRSYDIENYNKALEYYTKDIGDLIKDHIYNLEKNDVITLKESFVKNENLLFPPFEINSQDAYLKFWKLHEQELISTINERVNKLVTSNNLKDFEFSLEEKEVESEEYRAFLEKHQWEVEKCPSCGAKIADNEQNYCERCGKKL
ncbi:MAG: zinc ribbon domain-containing protein [Promethearchaeota archaeon]